MTESEWLACADPKSMLHHHGHLVSVALFSIGCVSLNCWWIYLPPGSSRGHTFCLGPQAGVVHFMDRPGKTTRLPRAGEAGRGLVFVGITTDEVSFRHPVFHRPEGTLLCSRNALSADFTRIIGLIEDGRLDTGPWITHRSAFEELIDVFPSCTKPETGVIKAVVAVGE